MILRNLNIFIKNNRILFTLLVVTQIAAVVIILFCFGIYRNNQYRLSEGDAQNYQFDLMFHSEGGSVVEFSRIKDALIEIAEKYDDVIDNVMIDGRCEIEEDLEPLIVGTYRNENGKVYVSSSFEYTEKGLVKGGRYKNLLLSLNGRYFTDEELSNGARVCVASNYVYKVHSDFWTIEGVQYEVIGHENYIEGTDNFYWDGLAFLFPYMSVPDGTDMEVISLVLKRPLLRSEYDELLMSFRSVVSEEEAKASDFIAVEIDEKATMRTMMLASVFMSFISAFAVCLIYRYMLARRVKTTAIYRICGCTVLKSAVIYIGEMMTVLAVSCMVGSFLFELLVEPLLEKSYTWFTVIYKSNACYLLVLLYFVMVSVIAAAMILQSCRQTPKEMLNSEII